MVALRIIAVGSLLALLGSPLAADVIVVDDSGGAAHTNIQDAVDAAVDGDVILVRAGSYTSFRIDDKSLSVVAAQGEQVALDGAIFVENLAFSRNVTLIRLQPTGLSVPSGAPEELGHALVARNNLGAVRALACSFIGSVGNEIYCDPFIYDCSLGPYYSSMGHSYYIYLYFPHKNGWDGVRIENCLQVSFAGCLIRGGLGVPAPAYYGFGGDGGIGVEIDGAQVAFYNCLLEGADGVLGGFTGGDGGHGLAIGGNAVFASGTTIRGGDGGLADDFILAYGGNGGNAVDVAEGAVVQLLEPTLVPGDLGISVIFPHLNGEPGVDVGGDGERVDIDQTARSLQVPIPIDDDTVLPLSLYGEPGDLAFLLISGGPGYLFDATLNGVVLVGAGLVKFQGIIDPTGVRTKNIPIDVLGPGDDVLQVYLQGIFVDEALDVVLGSYNHLVVLDPAL